LRIFRKKFGHSWRTFDFGCAISDFHATMSCGGLQVMVGASYHLPSGINAKHLSKGSPIKHF